MLHVVLAVGCAKQWPAWQMVSRTNAERHTTVISRRQSQFAMRDPTRFKQALLRLTVSRALCEGQGRTVMLYYHEVAAFSCAHYDGCVSEVREQQRWNWLGICACRNRSGSISFSSAPFRSCWRCFPPF